MTNKWLYPCGCAASPGSPDYCPEHGQPESSLKILGPVTLGPTTPTREIPSPPPGNPPSTGATDADRYAYNLDQFRQENDRLRLALRLANEHVDLISEANADLHAQLQRANDHRAQLVVAARSAHKALAAALGL